MGTSTAKRFHALDGLRGLLALAVAVHHSTLNAYVPRGYAAVDVFFVMSGFVLVHAYGRKNMRVVDFAYARFARLWPLHAFLILLVGVLVAVDVGVIRDQASVPRAAAVQVAGNDLLLLNALSRTSESWWGFNGVSWSISVELWAGFVVLLVSAKALQAKQWNAFWFLTSTALFGYVIAQKGDLHSVHEYLWGPVQTGLARGIAGIALGAVVYRSSFRLAPWMAELALAAMALLIATRGGRLDILMVPLTVVLLKTLTDDPGRGPQLAHRFLALRPLVWLGSISYALYLGHQVFYRITWTAPIPTWLQIAGAVVFGYVLHHLIEVPSQRFLRNIGPGKRRRRKDQVLPGAGTLESDPPREPVDEAADHRN